MSHLSYTCLYSGEDGKSYFKEVPVETPHKNPLGKVSNPFGVKELFFRQSIQGTFGWHSAPQNQYIVYLTGTVEIEASGGEKRTFHPGDVLLAMDTKGEGHRTTILTEGKALVIPLEK